LSKAVVKEVRGKKGAPNRWRVPKEFHDDVHHGAGGGKYNERWKQELGKLLPEEVTAENVRRIRDELVEEFGLGIYKP